MQKKASWPFSIPPGLTHCHRLQNCSSSSSLHTEHCLHTTFPKSMGLFRLEKTFQIKSSSSPSTKCPWKPHPHGFSIPAGVVAPSLPCSLPSLPWTQQSCCFVPLEIAPQTPGSFGHRVGSSLTVPRVLRPWAITLKSFQTISHPLDQLMSPQAVCLLCECLFLTSWLKTLRDIRNVQPLEPNCPETHPKGSRAAQPPSHAVLTLTAEAPEVNTLCCTCYKHKLCQILIIYNKPVLLDRNNSPLQLNRFDNDGKFWMFWNWIIWSDIQGQCGIHPWGLLRHFCPYISKRGILETDKTCLKCVSWYLVYLVLFSLGNFITHSAISLLALEVILLLHDD